MSRHDLPAGVPCAVCMARIDGWAEENDDIWRARPCGHLLSAINRLLASVPRASFGQPLATTASSPV